MPTALQPHPRKSLREIAALAAGVALTMGCTNSKPDDVASDAGATPSLQACQRLPVVRSGNRFQSDDQSFDMTLDELAPDTPSLGDNRWQLSLRDADARPVNDATVSFALWMPEHAHGSLKAVLVDALDEGQYRAEPLSFHMPGIWEITIQIVTGTTSDALMFETCVVP